MNVYRENYNWRTPCLLTTHDSQDAGPIMRRHLTNHSSQVYGVEPDLDGLHKQLLGRTHGIFVPWT